MSASDVSRRYPAIEGNRVRLAKDDKNAILTLTHH